MFKFLVLAGFIFPGLTHGALDAYMLRIDFPKTKLITIISVYVLISLLILAVWMWSASIIFFFFIIYSAFHFGEMDLLLSKSKGMLSQVIYGLLLLAIYFSFHATEVAHIVAQMLSQEVSIFDFSFMKYYGGIALLVWSILVLLYSKRNARSRWLIRITIVGASQFLPLIESFSIYYFILHSWPSLVMVQRKLKKSKMQLFILSLPYVLATLVVITSWILVVKEDTFNLQIVYAAIFILISAISLPHTFVMHRLIR